MARNVRVGDQAPDFSLTGWHDGQRRDLRLSAHRGAPVVLAFYPGDENSVCTKQLCSYSEDWDALTGTGAQVWGISPQGVQSHVAFALNHGLKMPLLSDPDLGVATMYGVGGRYLKRSIFVIDAAGTVTWLHVAKLGLRFRGSAEITAVLSKL
ncbi:peroxiredoxin [soil metagenome]